MKKHYIMINHTYIYIYIYVCDSRSYVITKRNERVKLGCQI